MPVANQILFHPYVYEQQKPTLDFAVQHGIVIEAFSLLMYYYPVDAPAWWAPQQAAFKHCVPPGRDSGPGPHGLGESERCRCCHVRPPSSSAAFFSFNYCNRCDTHRTSSKESRLKGYLAAADLKLTSEDVEAIDEAGADGSRRLTAKTLVASRSWTGARRSRCTCCMLVPGH